ncbi:MAG: hypothetical protein JSS76_12445 [Bacteroidetes bacterium]|nr:hypothetical protein [Bacteroidota bacterium]
MKSTLSFLLGTFALVASGQSLTRHYEIHLSNGLGLVVVDIPNRYDTIHHWTRHGCAGYDDAQVYRIQSSANNMEEENGDWGVRAKDTLDDITILHPTDAGQHSRNTLPVNPLLFSFVDTVGLMIVNGQKMEYLFATKYDKGFDTSGKAPLRMQPPPHRKFKKAALPQNRWFQQYGLVKFGIGQEPVTVEFCRRSPCGLKEDFITECMAIIGTLQVRKL